MRLRAASKAVLLVVLVGPWLGLMSGRGHAQEAPITVTPEDSEIVLYFLGTRDSESQTITLVTPTQGANPPSAVLDGVFHVDHQPDSRSTCPRSSSPLSLLRTTTTTT